MASSRRMPWLAATTRPVWVWGAWLCSPVLRSITTDNARWLLGLQSTAAQRRRLGRAVVNQFFLFMHDVARGASLSPDALRAQIDAVEGDEHFDAARRLGRGLIVATAHLGSYEVGMAALRERDRGPIHVLFQRDRLDQFDRLREQLHRKLSITDARLEDGLVTWSRLRDALRRNEVVVLQADRVMPGQKGRTVPFFGGTARFPTGPTRLASMTGAPIVPIFTVRRCDGRVRIVIHEAIPVAADDDAQRSAMLQLTGAIERQVRAAPHQWLALHRPWRHSGEGDD